MSSKTDILSRIRRNQPTPLPLPDLDAAWTEYADRETQFLEVLTMVGGAGLVVADQHELTERVAAIPVVRAAQKVVCPIAALQASIPAGSLVELEAIDNPHQLSDIDVAILPGEFAVAENAAVWVSDAAVRHRAIYFIAQHLVLVVPRQQMIDHLHQAYDRLSFAGAGYGLFISGPSKTADIEQSLVIGAHGPRSLTVLLVGNK
ncbi:MAG: lactate utilization protein [Pirellulaceae bacterium]|jgi:L-lactate dehydrogenase complex protein LldG|nr:lactate utilization protein [Pirellulaceae bacterium]